jgi:hypothetical protein
MTDCCKHENKNSTSTKCADASWLAKKIRSVFHAVNSVSLRHWHSNLAWSICGSNKENSNQADHVFESNIELYRMRQPAKVRISVCISV